MSSHQKRIIGLVLLGLLGVGLVSWTLRGSGSVQQQNWFTVAETANADRNRVRHFPSSAATFKTQTAKATQPTREQVKTGATTPAVSSSTAQPDSKSPLAPVGPTCRALPQVDEQGVAKQFVELIQRSELPKRPGSQSPKLVEADHSSTATTWGGNHFEAGRNAASTQEDEPQLSASDPRPTQPAAVETGNGESGVFDGQVADLRSRQAESANDSRWPEAAVEASLAEDVTNRPSTEFAEVSATENYVAGPSGDQYQQQRVSGFAAVENSTNEQKAAIGPFMPALDLSPSRAAEDSHDAGAKRLAQQPSFAVADTENRQAYGSPDELPGFAVSTGAESTAPETLGTRQEPEHEFPLIGGDQQTETASSEAGIEGGLSEKGIIEQRALQHIAYGKSLARRGATFAARQEFLQAMRLVAEADDMRTATRDRMTALAEALQALQESDDFVADDSQQQLTLDLKSIIESHNSRVIDAEDAESKSAISAAQAYGAFARDRLATAIEGSLAGTEALVYLGRLTSAVAAHEPAGRPMDRTKAMVMFEAAIAAGCQNPRCAHQLARLMAENGQLERAKELLLLSLRQDPTPDAWQDLALIHDQLNETALAQLARAERDSAVGAGAALGKAKAFKLISPAEFQGRSWPAESLMTNRETSQRGPNRTANRNEVETPTASKKKSGWFKSLTDWF